MDLKFFSMFSGIGAPEKALENLGINYELVGYSEIDKYASRSYSAIHGVPESKNLGDITKVDAKELPKDIDLVFYGFPCQDISNAGKMKGLFNEDGTQTRSGLFFEALRIIEETQPKIAIAENVKNLTSKRFRNQFKIVLDSLEEACYHNYWKVLNAKDFGIPQNRERVFIVSIRKDIDTGFQFPEGFPLEKRLKDILEDEVDEKYYLPDDSIKVMVGKRCSCSGPEVIQIGNCCPTKTRDNPNQGRVYDSDGLSPSLNCMEGGNRQPFVMVKEATKKGYAEAIEGDSVNLEQPNSKTRRGRVGKGVAQTLTTSCNQAVVDEDVRLRKLTPKECFRLLGFDDESFHRAEAVNSNSQLYKQAGNSIVVPVLEHIFRAIYEI